MNILIVSQYFWPESFRINDLALGLKERGHQVTVLTGIPNYPAGKFFPEYGIVRKRKQDYHGVKIVRVPIISRGQRRGLRLALNYLSYAVSGSIFGPLLCMDIYDLIFVCQLSPVSSALPGIRLSKLRSIPLILWIQDLWPESLTATGVVKSNRIVNVVSSLVNYIYRSSDSIWVQSEAFTPFLENKGVDVKKIRYFPNWAEGLYKPIEKDCTNISEGFRIIFAGNIGVAQDFGTILAAAEIIQNISDIRWIIIGDGSSLKWLKDQIKQRKLENNVQLLGRHPVEEMPRFYSQADALLVTLKKDPIFALTIPSKIQSYMACGKPIVAALEGEGAHVINESGAGIVCHPEDPTGLAKNVLKLYRMSSDERKQMGLNGRQYFEQYFERERLIDRAEEWIRKLVE